MALGHVEGPSMIQVYFISDNVKGILLYSNSQNIGHVGHMKLLMSYCIWVSRAS